MTDTGQSEGPEAPAGAATGRRIRSFGSANLTSPVPLVGPGGQVAADIPGRVVAWIVDVLVLTVLGLLLGAVVGGLLGGVVDRDPLSPGYRSLNLVAFLVSVAALLAASLAYLCWPWTTRRATFGLQVLGLRIADERDAGAIGLDQALTRWLVIGIPTVLLTLAVWVDNDIGRIGTLVGLGWLIGLLITLVQSPTRQGIHDRYAHTVIVRPSRRAR